MEIKEDGQKDILSFRNYKLETENNTIKSSTGLYIINSIDYTSKIGCFSNKSSPNREIA